MLDITTIAGAAMLLLIEKTGRKVLNKQQIEAFTYITIKNMEAEHIDVEIKDEDFENLDDIIYWFGPIFYVVKTENDYYIILGDTTTYNDLKSIFRDNLPKGHAKCYRAKNNLTALLMPDLILTEKRIEEENAL